MLPLPRWDRTQEPRTAPVQLGLGSGAHAAPTWSPLIRMGPHTTLHLACRAIAHGVPHRSMGSPRCQMLKHWGPDLALEPRIEHPWTMKSKEMKLCPGSQRKKPSRPHALHSQIMDTSIMQTGPLNSLRLLLKFQSDILWAGVLYHISSEPQEQLPPTRQRKLSGPGTFF